MNNIEALKEALKNVDLYDIEEALKERLQDEFENAYMCFDGLTNLDSNQQRILKFYFALNN
jgi:hypothetical protein